MSQFSESDFYYNQQGAGPSVNYKWPDNQMEGGISYEMDADFGQEQQFQSFDYSQATATAGELNSAQLYPSLQGFSEPNYFVPPTSYTGQLLDPTASKYTGPSTTSPEFEDEPPLLEELGINPDHIFQKTLAVLNPFRETDASILQDTDLAGPLAFCLAFGAFLLLSGKVHFSYIYGIGVLGCLAMYALLNLMAVSGVSIGVTVSVLGYCLLPMVALSGLSIVVSLQGLVGIGLTAVAILWCTLSSSKLFVTALTMDRQQPLVAYPCALLYGVFALLTIF